MVITSSRALSTKCWRKAFNEYHRNLVGQTATALVDGGAAHVGIAHGLATKDWDGALLKAKADYDARIGESSIPPEQSYLIEDHWDLTKAMVERFAEGLKGETYEVVQPESGIDLALPNTEHNDITLHHYELDLYSHEMVEHWCIPTPETILEKRVFSPHSEKGDSTCPCWQPHRFLGQTDAIVVWEGNLWLLEHKTTSITGDMFWAQWELDLQPTAYLYGIWKTLGIQPRGVIVNALSKPSEKQVSNWNAKRKSGPPKTIADYIGYERRAILRTTEDLLRVERILIDLCDEWEWRILNGNFNGRFMRGVCTEYNRRCDYFTPCTLHEEEGSFGGLVQRTPRYDDKRIAELVQITKGATQ